MHHLKGLAIDASSHACYKLSYGEVPKWRKTHSCKRSQDCGITGICFAAQGRFPFIDRMHKASLAPSSELAIPAECHTCIV